MNKEKQYQEIINLVNDAIKNNKHLHYETLLCEIVNYYKMRFPYMDWVGFYLFDKENPSLYLGPYIGDDACEYIPTQNGVCGKAYTTKKTQKVDDVHTLAYHIACSSSTNSELVIPVISNDECVAVLDLDSDEFASFDDIDVKYGEEICALLAKKY